MSQLVIVIQVPDHSDAEVTDFIELANETVRLVKLQHPIDDGFALVGVALGDEDTIADHFYRA